MHVYLLAFASAPGRPRIGADESSRVGEGGDAPVTELRHAPETGGVCTDRRGLVRRARAMLVAPELHTVEV